MAKSRKVKLKIRQLCWQEKTIEGVDYWFAKEFLFKIIMVIAKVSPDFYEGIISQQDMMTLEVKEPRLFQQFNNLEDAKEAFQMYFELLVGNLFFENGTHDLANKGDKETLELLERTSEEVQLEDQMQGKSGDWGNIDNETKYVN